MAGTIGAKVLSGMKKIEIDKKLVSEMQQNTSADYQWFIDRSA